MALQSTFRIMSLCSTILTVTKKPHSMFMNSKLNHYYHCYSRKEQLHYLLMDKPDLVKRIQSQIRLKEQFTIYLNFLRLLSSICLFLKFMEEKCLIYLMEKRNQQFKKMQTIKFKFPGCKSELQDQRKRCFKLLILDIVKEQLIAQLPMIHQVDPMQSAKSKLEMLRVKELVNY